MKRTDNKVGLYQLKISRNLTAMPQRIAVHFEDQSTGNKRREKLAPVEGYTDIDIIVELLIIVYIFLLSRIIYR